MVVGISVSRKNVGNRNELSSMSGRFLVNFQTKKAMIPTTAMPTATDMPMIDPVPRPASEEEGWGTAVDVVLDEADLVKVTTTPEPLTVVGPTITVSVIMTSELLTGV